jgi:hypothetical protein
MMVGGPLGVVYLLSFYMGRILYFGFGNDDEAMVE